MKYDPRVLIVEDTKYWQDIFAKILTSRGYRIMAARSYEEAKGILDRQSFDVAIVDIRLSEGDKDNKDGMKVLEAIRVAGDPTNIIMVSGAGDVQLTRDAFKIYKVLDFVKKDTFDMKGFIQLIEDGTQGARAYGVGHKSLIQTFLRETGLTDLEVSLLPGSADNVEELLQDIYEKIWPLASAPQISSRLITTQGGSKIAQIIGWSKAMGEAVVARLGSASIINKESDNFNRHVKDLIGNIEVKIGPFYKKENLGGLLYVLSDAEPSPFVDFTSFYAKEKVSEIIDFVERLFRYSAGKFYSDKTVDTFKVDLSMVYSATIKSLRENREQELEKDKSGLLDVEDEYRQSYLLERDQKMYPIEFVQEHSFVFESPVGMVHGDLCDGNIILDSKKRIWLLGFYDTRVSDVMLNKMDKGDSPALRAYQVGKRNLLHDFATLEVSIRKTLTAVKPEAVAAFDLILCKPRVFGESISLDATFSIPELTKASKVVARIRDLANELVDFKGDMQLYYAELLFQFFGVYLRVEDLEKERIWPTIVKLTERLRDWR